MPSRFQEHFEINDLEFNDIQNYLEHESLRTLESSVVTISTVSNTSFYKLYAHTEENYGRERELSTGISVNSRAETSSLEKSRASASIINWCRKQKAKINKFRKHH